MTGLSDGYHTRMNQASQILRFVLAELAFPAQRWAILTAAALYGADSQITAMLFRLPESGRYYRSVDDIVAMLRMAQHDGTGAPSRA